MKIKNDIDGTIIFKVPEFSHISETFILKQVIFAIELGYEVKILVRRLIPENQWAKSDKIAQHKLRDRIIVEDFRIPPNKFSRVLKWIQIFFFELKNIIPLINYHILKPKFSLTWLYEWNFYQKLNDVSLFHIQYGTNKYPLDQLIEVGYQTKIICSFHGHDAEFPINGFIPNDNYYNLLFKNSNLIVVNTPFLQKKLIELECPSDKLYQIPVSVDTDFFTPARNPRENDLFQLVTVGRLHKSKGHIYMLEVLKELLKREKKYRLTIIGEGPMRGMLESIISDYNLEANANLLGAKSHNEILEVLHQSDLYLFTAIDSQYGEFNSESQGLSISEAMSCGLPVVCFDCGGVKYTFEDSKSGFLIPQKDIEQTVKKINYLYENRGILSEMGMRARIFTKLNYSDDLIRGKWKSLYEQTI